MLDQLNSLLVRLLEWNRTGVQNITDNDGFAIALTGMTIVFTALVLITLFITALPRTLARLERFLGLEKEHRAAPAAPVAGDDEAVAAAIGFALHFHRQGRSS